MSNEKIHGRGIIPDTNVMPAHDAVNHPAHYTSDPSGVECIQITRHRNFNIGNAIKYLWRAGLKGGNANFVLIEDTEKRTLTRKPLAGESESEIQDLNKAIWYIQDEIKRLGGTVTVKI